MWRILTCVTATTLLILGLSVVLRADPTKKPGRQTEVEREAIPASLPTPLPAELFQGRVREAYRVAGEIPDVLAGLACYCGCDKSIGHRNLLDCFVDDHGAG
jgi:hypothetical protein